LPGVDGMVKAPHSPGGKDAPRASVLLLPGLGAVSE
jgi:hypothetical protein